MSLRLPLHEAQAIHARNGGKVEGAPKKPTKRSKLEGSIEAQLERMNAPTWEIEYKFHCIREWRFDLAWPELRFAVEVDGTIRSGQGDHQTVEGITNDCQKMGEALLWGWQVYRCTAPMIKDGEAAAMILRLLTRRQAELSFPPGQLALQPEPESYAKKSESSDAGASTQHCPDPQGDQGAGEQGAAIEKGTGGSVGPENR